MPDDIDPTQPRRRRTPPRADDPPADPRASQPAADATAGPQAPDADAMPAGTGLGKYRILERIAAGPNATLYKARDHLLDRTVVIKQLAPRLADDPAACGRFRREAYILAQIGQDARYVVAVHELIEQPRGLFLVTEYVPGWSLDTLIAKRQLSLQAQLELIARILLGARSIHAAGFIHRDLAPRHLIADVRCRPKITDFSLATTVGSEPDYTIASPPYTAPEVYLREPFDDRADIYAIGVIAYEMLVGRPAFRRLIEDRVGPGDDPIRWLAWHASDPAPWPDAHELNPQVPPVLSAIVAQMLAFVQDERFASVDDVLTLLVRHFSRTSRPVIAGPGAPTADTRTLPGMPPVYAAPPALPGLVPEAADWRSMPPPSEPFARPTMPPATAATPAEWVPADFSRAATAAGSRQTQTISVPVGHVEVAAATAPAASPWQGIEPRKVVVPPTWVMRAEPGPSSGSRAAPRARRLRRRVLATLTILIGIGGAGYGAYRVVPLVYLSPNEAVTRLINEARSAYSANDFRKAVDLLRQAASKDLHGAEGFALRDDAARWLALSEARAAMLAGQMDRAEDRLREAVALGINPDLVADLHRELIKAQSAARLKKRFGNGEGNGDAPAEAAPEQAPPAEAPPPAAPRPVKPKNGERVSVSAENAERAYRRAISRAREAVEQEEYDDAVDALRQASAVRQTLEVDELADRVLRLRERRQELKLAELAMSSGDFDVAARHYREAQKREPSPDTEKKLRRAVALGLMSEGRELLNEGRAREAENKFRAAGWRDPTAGAEKELESLRPAMNAIQAVEKADRAMSEGDATAALRLFESALPDLPAPLQPDVEMKIARLRAAGSVDRK